MGRRTTPLLRLPAHVQFHSYLFTFCDDVSAPFLNHAGFKPPTTESGMRDYFGEEPHNKMLLFEVTFIIDCLIKFCMALRAAALFFLDFPYNDAFGWFKLKENIQPTLQSMLGHNWSALRTEGNHTSRMKKSDNWRKKLIRLTLYTDYPSSFF